MVICLERDADLHMAQLMPPPLTVYCFTKIQIGFTFLVPADPGSPGKRAVKRVCVSVFVCAEISSDYAGGGGRIYTDQRTCGAGFPVSLHAKVASLPSSVSALLSSVPNAGFSTSSVSVHVHTTQQHLNAGFSTSSVSVHVHTTQQHFNTLSTSASSLA